MLNHKAKEHPVSVCSVCGDYFEQVANLQQHILKNHCMQSTGQVAETLKMHLQLLNTVLTNQTAMEQRLNMIAVNQSTMVTDMHTIKEAQMSLQCPRVMGQTPPWPPL